MAEPSMYRGEVRPRRQPTRHHIVMHVSSHRHDDTSVPFKVLSNAQFPALYIRSPVRRQYRNYMRAKSPYQRQRS
jgi:hypothetical protein